jgi:hypothetical protein
VEEAAAEKQFEAVEQQQCQDATLMPMDSWSATTPRRKVFGGNPLVYDTIRYDDNMLCRLRQGGGGGGCRQSQDV